MYFNPVLVLRVLQGVLAFIAMALGATGEITSSSLTGTQQTHLTDNPPRCSGQRLKYPQLRHPCPKLGRLLHLHRRLHPPHHGAVHDPDASLLSRPGPPIRHARRRIHHLSLLARRLRRPRRPPEEIQHLQRRRLCLDSWGRGRRGF